MLLNKMTTKILFGIVLLIIILSGILVGYGIYEGKRNYRLHEKRIQQKEETFRKNPNLVQCLSLMDVYYWDFHNNDKVLFYAHNCIKLDVDMTQRGWYVHALMADAYWKTGKLRQACDHLNIAFNLDSQQHMTKEAIQELRLKDLLTACK